MQVNGRRNERRDLDCADWRFQSRQWSRVFGPLADLATRLVVRKIQERSDVHRRESQSERGLKTAVGSALRISVNARGAFRACNVSS